MIFDVCIRGKLVFPEEEAKVIEENLKDHPERLKEAIEFAECEFVKELGAMGLELISIRIEKEEKVVDLTS